MKIGAFSASGIAVVLAATIGIGCGPQQAAQVSQAPASSTADLMKQRGLTEADVSAALQTYTPTGKWDEYITFASGGHGGNLIVIGVPSMRILKYVGVFTPEPWQGYGYGDQSNAILQEGSRFGKELTWGDMHHPALSETKGDYDGQFIFVNDKANPRVAVIDLHDFVTKQIVTSTLIQADHGATFVTPNTEYVVESSQYPAPLGGGYAPIEDFQEKYRGAAIFWKFDREKGKIDPTKSFAIELPPYMQDLADAGKLDSEGWVFINSFDTEMAHGGDLEGNPPLESGASQNDMDYMHIINLRAAEAVAKAGKTKKIAGMDVISLDTAIEEGLLHLVGEPKSPHGVDVTPDGKELVVSGKLDTHATVYEFAKIKSLIEQKKYAGKDAFGVPILPFEDSIRGQVELGLGPLHTQYDDKGNAYTSLFIESAIAKWSIKDLKVLEKVKVHYNVGHIVAAEGDTVNPDGHYLISMNKWAIDRFSKVGPLLPQNFQLININSEPMQLLYDMPLPLGEPHYAQMIKADKLHPVDVYKPAGYDAIEDEHSPNAVKAKEERIVRDGKDVHVYMTAVRSHFTPDIVRVKKGDTVHLHITNVEQAHDATHGFTVGSYNVHSSLEPGKHVDITFLADREGTFPFYCTEFCSALHLEMAGYLLVEPS
jgi:nitrous-oxide reductase